MTAKFVARVSVGSTSPALGSLLGSAVAGLSAQVAGALALQASVTLSPPTLAARIQAAESLLASLQASIDLPTVNVSVGIMGQVIVALQAQLSILLQLQNVMLTAGVYVLTHNGLAPTFGSEMQAKISPIAPPQNMVHSVTYLATDPAVFEALGAILLTG